MRTVSRPGIEPTGDGGPPRCFARTEVDALADSYPVEEALAVIRNVVSAPTDAVRDAVNVPFAAVVPLVADNFPPTAAGMRSSATVAPANGLEALSRTVTVTAVLWPGSRTALERSTETKSRWGSTRTVIATVPLAASYPGFVTSAVIIASCVTGTEGAANADWKRPSWSVAPVAGVNTPSPLRATLALSTGIPFASATLTMTFVDPPDTTEFEKGVKVTTSGPRGTAWRAAKDQKLSIPPGSATQPSNRSML